MKTVNVTIAAFSLLALLLTSAHASNNQVGGLIIGGGTGAIVGQAVGRNVESTIIGATVGSILGFTIGNELDRQHRSVTQRPQIVAHSAGGPRYNKRSQPIFRDHYRHNNYRKNHNRDYPRYRHKGGKGRKIVTIKKGHHRTKRVGSTVYKNSPRNHNKKHNRYRYSERYYR